MAPLKELTEANFFADLHCHTTCSDGSKNPEELVYLAKEIGLKALSITDHDNIEAYSLALPVANSLKIDLLPGVEFSTMHKKNSIHILGYGYLPDSPIIEEFCEKHCTRRNSRNKAILKLLKIQGFDISYEEFMEETKSLNQTIKKTIGRPHIALLMMKKGYVKTVKEAFQKYLGEGKICYAEGDSFSTEETIDIIHAAKGIAVIAHPHLIDQSAIFRDLLTMNFDGIECYYGRFNRDKHERFLKVAKKKNWLITGGSDFHGEIKPDLPLGSSFIDEENFNKIKTHLSLIS